MKWISLGASFTVHTVHNSQFNMKVSVFDTYVRKANSDTAHFDIIVPEGKNSLEEVIAFGKNYLESIGEVNRNIATTECQFCHIEEPTAEMLEDIGRQGYHVLVMEDIPAVLPTNPTRRNLIEHIRAKSMNLRFANFKGRTEDELREMVANLP